MNYYNDIDPYCAAWLENLIKEKLIPDGKVDSRSIADVEPTDLDGFTQCHFFAGIAGWPRALALARWGADRQVWTASCPCQPFSVAGKGKGVADERHLWPHVHRLVRACRPGVVMGEQVSGAAGLGWLDGVVADMEAEGYTVRAADIPACAVNAPHRRNRLYWVAYAQHAVGRSQYQEHADTHRRTRLGGGGREYGGLAHSVGVGLEGRQSERRDPRQECETVERCRDECGRMDNPNQPGQGDEHLQGSRELGGIGGDPQADIGDFGMEHAEIDGLENSPDSRGDNQGVAKKDVDWRIGQRVSTDSFWSSFTLAGPDRDGKWRRVGLVRESQPGVCELVDGLSAGMAGMRPIELLVKNAPQRVNKLRALGNAIVPPLAAEFVAVVREMIDGEK